MSIAVIDTAAALEVAYTNTPGTMNGIDNTQIPGKVLYLYSATTDTWIAQGIDDTAITSESATADTLTVAAGHKLVTGMPVQVSALGDTAIAKAWQVSAGGAFVDLTTAINNGTANDVQPFATGVLNDYMAVGYTTTVGQLKFVIGTSGTVGTATWEYWNGSAWTALSGLTDNTTQLKAAPGTVTVVYTTPSDWAPLALNGGAALYYIRVRALTTYTVNPLLTQGWVDGVLPTGLSGGTTYWAIVSDPNTFKLATTRANALAGTAIDLTSNGGGITATTVATAGAGSAFIPAKTPDIFIDGSYGAKVSVVQDASGGKASLTPVGVPR